MPLCHGGQRAAAPVWCSTIEEEVDVHQLRVSHWRRSEQYHHRIGRRPTDKYQQCSDTGCPAVRCLVCRLAKDIPAHILLECPYLLGLRLLSLGNIFATDSDIRKGDVVADLAAGYRPTRAVRLPRRFGGHGDACQCHIVQSASAVGCSNVTSYT